MIVNINYIDMGNVGQALFLMCVGLATVFVVLVLIIELGKLLIFFCNKFLPEEVVEKPAAKTPAINANVYSAICSAVSTVTGGKGSVVEVKKL